MTKLVIVVNRDQVACGLKAQTSFRWTYDGKLSRYDLQLPRSDIVEYAMDHNCIEYSAAPYMDNVVGQLLQQHGLRMRLHGTCQPVRLEILATYNGDSVTLAGDTYTFHHKVHKLSTLGFIMEHRRWVLQNPAPEELDIMRSVFAKHIQTCNIVLVDDS